jgi:hypothetical protein
MQKFNLQPLFNQQSPAPDKNQPLTPQQAIAVFDWLAGMKDVAYQYATDGCYARAHIMCRRLMAEGLTLKKAWAFEEEGEYYRVLLQDGSKQRFGFHVAPVLPVMTAKGAVVNMIFDPAFFNGPVTEQEWGGIVTNGWPPVMDIKPFGVAPSGYANDYIPRQKIAEDLDQHAMKVMEDHFARTPTPARIFPSSLRNAYAPQNDNSAHKYENK